MKNKKIKVITLIIFLIIILIGISFAITSPSINLLGRREIKISKCELDINFKESDELMLVSKYPISKEEALKYEAKDITITNNSTCDTAYYRLTIKDLNSSSINKDIINYQLIDNSTNTETIDKNPDNFKVSGSLTKGNSKSYSIRLWIDESATNTDLYENGDTTKPYEYKYALNIETSDEEIKESMTASEFMTAKVGTDGLETVTHTIDDTLQVGSDFATEYRYRGGDVNNYVTFNNETWRIIGILPTEDTDGNVEYRFKIIRDTSIGEYYWNTTQDTTTSSYNNWVTGTLNTYLNGDYYNSLSTDTQNMIGTVKYYLGGYNSTDIASDVMWQYERKKTNGSDCTLNEYFLPEGSECYFYKTNPVVQSDANKRIALMYASDYGYGASTSCSATLVSYSESTDCITTNNWLYKGLSIWTLSQSSSSDTSVAAFHTNVDYSSALDPCDCGINYRCYTYPVLYLSSFVKISSGSGTSSDPYTLSVN